MRKLAVLALLAGAVLTAASCAGSVFVGGRSSESPSVARHDSAEHPAHLGIPLGHLPPPGMCRVWLPGQPPGHQPAPAACSRLANQVPAGAWLVYRPSGDRKHVEVSVYHKRRPGTVIAVGVYEAESGEYVRDGRITASR